MAEEIVGNYRLVNVMLTGHSMQTWEVTDMSGRRFCMKLLLPEKAGDPAQRRMLFNDGEVGKLLAHPNLLKTIEINKDARNPYVVTEFFPIASLKHRIVRKQFDFIKEHAARVITLAATGLGYMNQRGWVHRDVKPDNIFTNNAGEVRVGDFALAQKKQKAGFFGKLFARKTTTQGTRSYMSPEQIRGEDLDERADVYSFGASIYEITTYRPPFRAGSNQELLGKHIAEKPVSPQAHNPDLSDEFAQLVLDMLAKKREQRPADFNQVLARLKKIRIYKSEAVASGD